MAPVLSHTKNNAIIIAMAHIHTQPGHHDFTASAFVIRTDGEQPKVMLHWHKKLHSWMQFGGHIELHETPWAALRHELLEESGYDFDQLQLLQPPHSLVDLGDESVAHPQPFLLATHPFGTQLDHFHTDISFVFTTAQKPRHHIGPDESTQIRLFSLQDVRELPDEQMVHNVRTAALYAFELLAVWRHVDPMIYR